MTLHFNGSNQPTIGIEIELQILDPATLDLVPQSEKLIEWCKQQGVDRVKTEIHQSMIEVDSEISKDIKECRAFLKKRLQETCRAAESLGLKLGSTGTHPFQKWSDRLISNRVRYKNLHDKFQWLTRRMSIYGMHVHVGVSSGQRALAISNVLSPYLPHLLALSASSPFWQEIDTGMNSSRLSILDAFPYSGFPGRFGAWEEFEHFYNTLHRIEVIKSMKDLYWYIRPNLGYGTIEFRICDGMSTLSETMAVAALIHCLVVWADQMLDANPHLVQVPMEYNWVIPDNLWVAAREGLNGIIIENLEGKIAKISDAVRELIERMQPIAAQLNCSEALGDLIQILDKGNGAQRQLARYQESKSLRDVVQASLDEFESDIFREEPATTI